MSSVTFIAFVTLNLTYYSENSIYMYKSYFYQDSVFHKPVLIFISFDTRVVAVFYILAVSYIDFTCCHRCWTNETFCLDIEMIIGKICFSTHHYHFLFFTYSFDCQLGRSRGTDRQQTGWGSVQRPKLLPPAPSTEGKQWSGLCNHRIDSCATPPIPYSS